MAEERSFQWELVYTAFRVERFSGVVSLVVRSALEI